MKQTQELGFLDECAGEGLDTISSKEQAVPYLSMVQPGSDAAAHGAVEGHWRNSATGEDYGAIVKVVPIAFRVIWNEREGASPFRTVGRYEPESIPVTLQKPAGGKGYMKMINPDTGNEVQELYIYAVMLPDHPEAGILQFCPTVTSMSSCKAWNTQLKNQLLPSGRQAPIYAFQWMLALDLVDNPQKPNTKMAKFVKAQRDTAIPEDIFRKYVAPQRPLIQQTMLEITQATGDAE